MNPIQYAIASTDAILTANLEDMIEDNEAQGPLTLTQALQFNDDWIGEPMCELCGSMVFDFIPGDPGILSGLWEDSYPPTDDECCCENCGQPPGASVFQQVKDAYETGRELGRQAFAVDQENHH